MRPNELRAICHEGKQSDPGWYRIHRRISIYLTWLLLRTRLMPNHITLGMMIVAAAGVVLLASPRLSLNGIGFGLLYLAFLLDKADGEVARYRQAQSPQGILLDRLHHLVFEPAILVAAAFREHWAGATADVWIAVLVTVVVGNVIEEQKHLPPYILFKHRKFVRQPRAVQRSAPDALEQAARILRALKAFRMFIVVLPTLALTYALQGLTGWAVVRLYLYTAAVALTAYLVFQTYYYFKRKLEEEITSLGHRAVGGSIAHRTEAGERPRGPKARIRRNKKVIA